MKKYSSLFAMIILFFVADNAMAQTGKVGINTSVPFTGLHIQDSGVLFNHGFYLFENFPWLDNAQPPFNTNMPNRISSDSNAAMVMSFILWKSIW